MPRIADIGRGDAFTIDVDGAMVPAFPGETIAAAILANDRPDFRRDKMGHGRGLWCNMGTCCECMVTLYGPSGEWRVRSCVVEAAPGQVVRTVSSESRNA